jgi:hypothetical protein
MNDEEARLAALTRAELVDELEVIEEQWVEVGLRLGVEGLHGIRAAAVADARTGEQAARLRRFAALWKGQPEAGA